MNAVLTRISSLTDKLPIDAAMPELTPTRPLDADILAAAERLIETIDSPLLRAGLWLYVDELDRSHQISQGVHTKEGSLWHAIMHRREGDFWNSKYWLRQAGDVSILTAATGDPFEFVDRVERAPSRPSVSNVADAERSEDSVEALVKLQRREWLALFEHCARIEKETRL